MMEIASRMKAKGLSFLSKVDFRVQPVCNGDGNNVLGGLDGMKLGTKSNQMEGLLRSGDHGIHWALTVGFQVRVWLSKC